MTTEHRIGRKEAEIKMLIALMDGLNQSIKHEDVDFCRGWHAAIEYIYKNIQNENN